MAAAADTLPAGAAAFNLAEEEGIEKGLPPAFVNKLAIPGCSPEDATAFFVDEASSWPKMHPYLQRMPAVATETLPDGTVCTHYRAYEKMKFLGGLIKFDINSAGKAWHKPGDNFIRWAMQPDGQTLAVHQTLRFEGSTAVAGKPSCVVTQTTWLTGAKGLMKWFTTTMAKPVHTGALERGVACLKK